MNIKCVYGSGMFGLFAILVTAIRIGKKRCQKKYFRCVALDLDGTTLNSQHQISDRTKRILQHLQSNGVRICVCTGRSVVSVLPILSTLTLASEVPIVVYNGSSSFMVSTDLTISRRLFSTPHTQDDAILLLRFASSRGLVAQYYLESSGDVFAVPTTEEHQEHLNAYAKLTGRKQLIGCDYKDAISQSAAAKVLLMTRNADQLIADAKVEFPDGKFNIIRGSPEPFFVEFLPANISKGSGLVNMCKAVDIALEEVVAFGDGENDVEFLQMAGLGVAMKNAKHAAKEKADIVLERTNDEDGVAIMLENMEKEGQFKLC